MPPHPHDVVIGAGGAQDTGQVNLGSPLFSLPPWDQTTYYGLPVETSVSVGATPVRILDGDDMRVRAVIGANCGALVPAGPNLLVLSLLPAIAATAGIPITQGGPFIIMTFDQWGPLIQQPWYAVVAPGVGGAVIVTTQVLRMIRFPGYLTSPNMLDTVNVNANANRPRCANGNGSGYGIGTNRWPESAAGEDSDIATLIEQCQSGHRPACDRYIRLAPGNGGVRGSVR